MNLSRAYHHNSRLILFYPLSAIVSIFCYIISNPQAPEASSDLELIGQMAVQIRELGEQEDKLSGEPSKSERAWKVVTALENLARCTIEKHNS
jgi:hypothetical protein